MVIIKLLNLILGGENMKTFYSHPTFEENRIQKNMLQFEEINKEYNLLSKKISELVKSKIERDEDFKSRFIEGMDYTVLNFKNNPSLASNLETQKVAEYRLKMKEIIQNNLRENNYKMDKQQLQDLLKIYQEEIIDEREYLSENNVGTTLNTLREYYSDLNASLVRIFKNNKSISLEDRLTQYNYALDNIKSFENKNANPISVQDYKLDIKQISKE